MKREEGERTWTCHDHNYHQGRKEGGREGWRTREREVERAFFLSVLPILSQGLFCDLPTTTPTTAHLHLFLGGGGREGGREGGIAHTEGTSSIYSNDDDDIISFT